MNKLNLVGKNGKYVLNSTKFLGEGSFSKVYEGNEEKSGDPCAIKILSMPQSKLSPEAKSDIDRESENIQGLENENIVSLLDIGDTNGRRFFVFEYCETDLEKVIKTINYKNVLRQGIFNEEHKQKMMNFTRNLLDGFREIFLKNLIHRDIKPSNLLISKGILKIGDFGLSRVIDDMFTAEMYTRKGTPLYASYEILKGEKFSSKCDVYSCGLVIFEMFFGFHPYIKDGKGIYSISQMIYLLKEGKIEIPPNNLPIALIGLIMGMVSVKEENRLNWRDVFLKVDEIFGNESKQNPETEEKCIFESINEVKKNPVFTFSNEILIKKIVPNNRLDILNNRMQINSFYQKLIYSLLENKTLFPPLVTDQLILSLNIIYKHILEEDQAFINVESSNIQTTKQYLSSLEKVKRNHEDCQKVIENMKNKISAEIRRQKKKSMLNRYFEVLISQEVIEPQAFEQFIAWIVLMQRKYIMAKISDGTLKLKEAYLVFYLIHSTDHRLTFVKSKKITEEVNDPASFRDSVDELTRSEISQCIEGWLKAV